MTATVIFFCLGVLDAFAELSLINKMYRLPMQGYWPKILLFVICISLFSLLMRMGLSLPMLDLPMQYLLFVLFLRFGMQIKTHLSAFIAGAGIITYSLVQILIFSVGNLVMNEGTHIIFQNNGSFIHFIQVTSDILVLAYAYFLKVTNRGFSFIIEPPHDFWIKENYMSSKNLMVLVAGGISFVTISLTFVLIYVSNILSFIIMAIIAFAISFYFSHRRDYDDVRNAVEKYRGENKRG